MHLLYVIQLIDLVAAGLQLGGELMARYEQASTMVKKIVAEGRNPTAEEHDFLMVELKSLASRAAAARLARESSGQ